MIPQSCWGLRIRVSVVLFDKRRAGLVARGEPCIRMAIRRAFHLPPVQVGDNWNAPSSRICPIYCLVDLQEVLFVLDVVLPSDVRSNSSPSLHCQAHIRIYTQLVDAAVNTKIAQEAYHQCRAWKCCRLLGFSICVQRRIGEVAMQFLLQCVCKVQTSRRLRYIRPSNCQV